MPATPVSPHQTPHADWTLADWLRWQETLHPKSIELGLARVREAAARLQLPDARIRTLTVAGTNGKGSSATLAAQIYREAGYRTGLYTSPHLLHYRERVAIDGEPVDDAALCRAFAAIESARGDIALTYFEFGTLAALWLFREAGVQVQVLEVGLGGRLDAVNLVDADAALITNIGLDHTDWLGPDRDSIAREKAGVMRRRRPAVFADDDMPDNIQRCAQDSGAQLQRLGTDYRYVANRSSWDWQGEGGDLPALPMPALAGAMQLRNAAGVIATVRALRHELPVADDAIRAALPRLRLRGRFERIGNTVLDVAHNAEAAQVLADNLRASGDAPVGLVLGMLSDKPVEAVAQALAPLVRRAYCAGLPGPRGLAGTQLAQRVRASGIDARAFDDVAAAYAQARREAGGQGAIVVAGSFLTVAAVADMLNG